MGLLLLALLAQIAGAAFLYLDYSAYGDAKPKFTVAPKAGPPPGPPGNPGGITGVPPGGMAGGPPPGGMAGGPPPGGMAGGPPPKGMAGMAGGKAPGMP